MDQANVVQSNPFVTRAQVLSQSYICFVYLPESCFRALAKEYPTGSAAKKCAQFLSNNPARIYRNAIAHANWTYRADFGAIIYWARKGSDPNEPLKDLKLSNKIFRFGKHSAGVLLMQPFPICSTAPGLPPPRSYVERLLMLNRRS
jgi:hypothetical protein